MHFNIFTKKEHTIPKKIHLLIQSLFFLIMPFFIHFYIQFSLYSFSMNEDTFSEAFLHSYWVTTIPFFLIELLFVALVANTYLGIGIFTFTFLVFGYANTQKINYRIEPIYPEDISMILEPGLLKEVSATLLFYSLLLLLFALLILLGYFIYKSRKLSLKIQGVRIGLFIFSLLGLLYISQYNKPNNLYRKLVEEQTGEVYAHQNQLVLYQESGFVKSFLDGFKSQAMAIPEQYSQKTIEDITEKYTGRTYPSIDDPTDLPNIIFIMDESFSDPSLLNGIELNNSPLDPYYHIAQQSISGQMLSPGYGGGTANIEFEALTSFSMERLNPQVATAYTQIVSKLPKVPSIVSLLSHNGYETTAIHPYNTSMYKRKSVYPKLGFDTFIYDKTMTYQEVIENNPYISDQASFDEVYAQLTHQPSKPQFVHLVTMQNHVPFTNKYTQTHYFAQNQPDNAEINYYLEDIAYTSKAFDTFIQKIDTLPRRTLVVFWGDHLPGIYSSTILNQNENWLIHQTPFLIYDNQKQLAPISIADVTSPIYFAPLLFESAQLNYPPFYQLLLDLYQEVPAFENDMYFYQNKWHNQLRLTSSVLDDYSLIQYDILQGKQYSLDSSFFTISLP